MIVFRAMQGFTGGALIPLAFTLTLIKLPEHHRAKGMAMFAMTATFAPSIGPTLGGWLTENWGWEYIFYINIPPGLMMIAGLLYGLEKKAAHWELLKSTDYAGILTLGVGLGCLQVFLEEGHRKDWLESNLIVEPGQHCAGEPDHLRDRAVFQTQSADQPGHPAQPQLRPVEHFQPGHGCRLVWLDLSAAAVSGADPGLQRPADRRSDHVDGRATAVSDSAGAAS